MSFSLNLNMGKISKEALSVLNLSLCKGIGNFAINTLIAEIGCGSALFEPDVVKLRGVEGISEKMLETILNGPDKDTVSEELELMDRCSVRPIAITEDGYPESLKNLGMDAPPLIRVRGSYMERDQLAIGLVGSRNCTHYGRVQARRFAMSMAEKGFTIVSGHARGIDSHCHRAAMQAGGRTIAVLGCGLARLEKLSEPELALDIAENGALVSELPMKAPPLARHFPPRNRLISGLSGAVVVIEAGAKSGTLITARCAAEQGKMVFAIPGSVESSTSHGCHQLIRDGAVLAESPLQVIDEMGPMAAPVRIENTEHGAENKSETVNDPRQLTLNEREKTVIAAIEHEPRLLDDITEEAGLPPSVMTSVLLTLEMKGLITRLAGDRYVLGSV